MGVTDLSKEKVLESVNAKRLLLSLEPLSEITSKTILPGSTKASAEGEFPKRIAKGPAIQDLNTLHKLVSELSAQAFLDVQGTALAALTSLNENPDLLDALAKEDLLNKSLELFDDKECPVCSTRWPPEEFVAIVKGKLEAVAAATAKRAEAEKLLQPAIELIERICEAIGSNQRNAQRLIPPVSVPELTAYLAALNKCKSALEAFLPLGESISSIASLTDVPKGLHDVEARLRKELEALPEPSAQDAARDFLVRAQDGMHAFADVSTELQAAQRRAELSKAVLDIYADVSTNELDAIYKAVQDRFGELYRFLNSDDESNFKAQLTPSMARLAFDVDFYGRGLFPPGAYHSEGHQDSMGLCLYLALMKHLMGEEFRLAVLDDVVMSVDVGHRREVCRMLKQYFPDTQFIVTTHDEIWLRHMCSVGLVDAKSTIRFRRWDVSQGPIEWTDQDVWSELDAYLAQDDVRSAAALLRHYLEYFSTEICDLLHARVEFRSDGRYELGALLPSAIGQMRRLLKRGKSAANSWGDKATLSKIEAIEKIFAGAVAETEVDNWQINPAVHYNAWANFVRKDFEPVVKAYRKLAEAFRCASCGGLFYLTLDGVEPDTLRCECTKTMINLKAKHSAK